jgi:hypothetical protein
LPLSVGEQPSYARPKEGRHQQKHRQQPSVHGAVICLLHLHRGREGVVLVRQGSVHIVRPLIAVCLIRRPKGIGSFESTSGQGQDEQGEEDPQAAENNPRQQGEEDEAVHRWLLC